MTDDELREQLHAHGLSRVADALVERMQIGLNITCRAVDETALPVGASKIGGSPDLPPGVPWPDSEGRAMAFLAQLSMTEVATRDAARCLPPVGLLSFFYTGSRVQSGNDWEVLYFADTPTSLERRSAPPELDKWSRFRACAVEFRPVRLLPEWHTVSVISLGLSDQEQAAFHKLCDHSPLCYNRDDSERWTTRLLGYPTNMEQDALLCSYEEFTEWSTGTPLRRSTRVQTQRAQEAARWRLLLQINSESEADMDWDSGFIYYCIEEEALQNTDFRDVWLTRDFL